MKSTYKLLGVFWDRKEIVETNFDVIRKCRDILDYRYVRELFDVNNYVRKIKVSELLMGKLTIIKTLMWTKMILMICFRLRLLDCVDYNEM